MSQEMQKANVLQLQAMSIDVDELPHFCLSIASSSSTANDSGCS